MCQKIGTAGQRSPREEQQVKPTISPQFTPGEPFSAELQGRGTQVGNIGPLFSMELGFQGNQHRFIRKSTREKRGKEGGREKGGKGSGKREREIELWR